MGARIEAERSRVKGAEAQAMVQQRVQERKSTEQMLMQQEQLLGTPGQVAGNLGGGVSSAELPYAGRYNLDTAAFEQIAGRTKWTAGAQAGVDKANDLLEQAQAAARAGNTEQAAALKAQADAALKSGLPNTALFNNLWGGPLQGAFQYQTDPNVEAATRLNSPLAQTVGANVARGRELADPNSAARQQLTQNIVNAPVAEINSGQRAALSNISTRTNSALSAIDTGFGQAISEITTGEAKSLSELDAGFGRALQAITVGEAKSIGEVDAGLQYALEAISKGTENALRAIESGVQGTRRAMTDQMRQRGAAARPFQAQAVQARTEEKFATDRAIVETERGKQDAQLQASAAGARAGIYERSNASRAQLEASEATQKSGVIMGAASQRAQLEGTQAQTTADIQIRAGLAEAQINMQATLAKADVMQRGQMFVEQFSADFSFQSVAQAQAFLNNQAGVREEYQRSLDNLAVAGAGFANASADRAHQSSMQLQELSAAAPAWLMVVAAIAGSASGAATGAALA